MRVEEGEEQRHREAQGLIQKKEGGTRSIALIICISCYPRRRVFVHHKRPQFEITEPQEEVERRPWRDGETESLSSLSTPPAAPARPSACQTHPPPGRPVCTPSRPRKRRRAPRAECCGSGTRRRRSRLLHPHLRAKTQSGQSTHPQTEDSEWDFFTCARARAHHLPRADCTAATTWSIPQST